MSEWELPDDWKLRFCETDPQGDLVIVPWTVSVLLTKMLFGEEGFEWADPTNTPTDGIVEFGKNGTVKRKAADGTYEYARLWGDHKTLEPHEMGIDRGLDGKMQIAVDEMNRINEEFDSRLDLIKNAIDCTDPKQDALQIARDALQQIADILSDTDVDQPEKISDIPENTS